MNQLIQGNCIEVMAQMPGESIDLVVTDPPFGIDFKADRGNYNRKAGNVLQSYSEVNEADYLRFTDAWLSEATRLLRPDGSMFIFSGYNNLCDILISARLNNLHLVNHIIWKFQFGVYCKKKFISSHYHVLYYCKDLKQRRFYPDCRYGQAERTETGGSARYQDMEDVWVINKEYWRGEQKTPTKLPTEVIRKILAYASWEGDVVIDPFMGSGQVPLVAWDMKRGYIGIEVEPEIFEFAKGRLEK